MKGRAIKAPIKPNANKSGIALGVLGQGGGLPAKLVVPKRNPSMLIQNSPPAGESVGGGGGEGSRRGETEIHRTGPGGEVNILRLDSNGETMLLEASQRGGGGHMTHEEGGAFSTLLRNLSITTPLPFSPSSLSRGLFLSPFLPSFP